MAIRTAERTVVKIADTPSGSPSSKNLELSVCDRVDLKAELIVHAAGPSGSGIRMSGDSGRNIAVDAPAGGDIKSSIAAPPRWNESNDPEVGRILIERLNADGGTWHNLQLVEDRNSDIDCTAEDYTAEATLNIQVTRPRFKRDGVWPTIGRGQVANTTQSPEDAVEELLLAIVNKQNIPPAQRKQLVLAVDAIETSGLVLGNVPETFKRKHGDWLRQLGFREVWVVGATSALTARLDA